jgi:hypothetical protein
MNGKLTVVSMVSGIIISFAINASALESMKFDNEAKKLDFIRQTLKKEKIVVPDKDPKYCAVMMKDFLAGKNFRAIEPDVRADSADDPRLARWRQCENKESKASDPQDIFDYLESWGSPPYRYYRIGLFGVKGKKPEDLIYLNEAADGPASSGYAWVNLKRCEIVSGLPTTRQCDLISKKQNAVILNALVYYKSRLWVVDYSERSYFKLLRRIALDRFETCRWRLFNLDDTD